MLRQRGRLNDALRLIDAHLGDRETADRWRSQLLVERARIMSAREDWQQSAADLDQFLASEYCRQDYREFSAACLMRGLLYQREGEKDLALELWQRGLHKNYLIEIGQQQTVRQVLTGSQASSALLLTSLCGDNSEQEISRLVASSVVGRGGGAPAQLVKQYSHVLVPAIKNMSKSERGQEVIWRIAFLELPLRQLLREPANLIFLELTRIGAAPGDWSREEEDIIWEMTNTGFELYSTDAIGMPQAVQFMLTWKGANNLFGWKGVAPSLDPSMRGPAAYVFGHRFMRLAKPNDAREFFQTALKDAPADSGLHELAKAALEKISDVSN